MGLMFGSAKKIAETFRKKFANSLLCLGNQSVAFFLEDICSLNLSNFQKKNLEYLKEDIKDISSNTAFSKSYINKLFFKILGISVIKSIDISKYQNADYLYDLNEIKPPKKLKKKFDCILDGSTIEHVFNTFNVLKNINFFLKKGGYIIHITGVNNMPKDGFYQFHPEFFLDFYSFNNFKIIKNLYWVNNYEKKIFQKNARTKRGLDKYFNDFEEANTYAKKNKLPLQIIFIAKKIIDTDLKIPQQKYYVKKKNWLKNKTRFFKN
jgi:hypothetical protein